MDSHGHGTGVAGVLGAVGNNGIGISGVAWNLRIMPIRATSTSNDSASFGSIQSGALWAAANGAKVISVSFAGIEDPAIDTLGVAIRSRNALLVWAMDNRGVDTDVISPFDHPSITVVSGSGLNDEHWCSFANPTLCSSFGAGVDIAAPAYSLAVTTIGGGYAVNEGVSFAAPQVAATLGMIWSLAPSMLPDEVEQVLLASADDIGPEGEDDFFGRGRLNVRRALWNAVIRQNATSLPPASYNTRAFSIDDVYDFIRTPMDVTGDGVVDHKEVPAVQAFMRRNESKDLVGDRP
jgi:subtilisin family serine protease